MASRLAQRGIKVLLVEAGDPVARHPNAFNCDLSGRYDWNLRATISGRRHVAVPRGKAVGGSSIMNTCVALRPDPWAFELWARKVPGWSWDDVAPYFRRLENDADFPTGALHGADGPVEIVRWRPDELEAPSRWFHDAAVRCGHPAVEDLNLPDASGVGPVPMNRVGDRRVSADIAYLRPLSGSSHLRVETGWHVDRLTVRQGRVNGAVARRHDTEQRFEAEHTVLCGGSYGTPGILLRSGIGAAASLKAPGIAVIHDLPGVGRGLHDHCQVYLEATGRTSSPSCPALQVMARLTSLGSTVTNDVQLLVLNRVDTNRYVQGGCRIARPVMLCALLMHSTSRGSVTIDPVNREQPRIAIDYIGTAGDRHRLREAIRTLGDVIDHGAEGAVVVREPFDVRQLSDEELDRLIAHRVQSAHHPMGTARMGRSGDNNAVVDEQLRVLGLDGVTIADASVVPLSLNANTHLTCTMIGERHADQLVA